MSSHIEKTLVAQCALALDGWRASHGADQLQVLRELIAFTAADEVISQEVRNDLNAVGVLVDGVVALARQGHPGDLEQSVFILKLMLDTVELSIPDDPVVVPFRPRTAYPQPPTQPPGSAA